MAWQFGITALLSFAAAAVSPEKVQDAMDVMSHPDGGDGHRRPGRPSTGPPELRKG